MQLFNARAFKRLVLFTSIGALAATLSACGGSSGGGIGSLVNTSATVRFINGSPDAGPVDVYIDNQHQFCPSSNQSCPSIAYGQATPLTTVKLSAGTHPIVIYPGGNDTGSGLLPQSQTISVNSGSSYTVVLTGEMHPANGGSSMLTLETIGEQPFQGGAAVNFHNASPFFSSSNVGSVQFGYYLNNTPASNSLGNPIGPTQATNPVAIASSAQNVPITFYAVSPTSGVTTMPNQWSSQCGSNAMPCDTGNLDLYLLDGPAASSSPTSPLPNGVTASATGMLVGAFDPTGF